MKIVNVMAAQGDVMFIRMNEEIPANLVEEKFAGEIVVAHSETGHHHSIAGSDVMDKPNSKLYKKDDFTMFLEVMAPYIDVVHHREFDTHETIRLKQGNWQIKRQREYTPQGYKRVED